MDDRLRREVHRIQQAHWLLLLRERKRWAGRQLLEHYRAHVEQAPELARAADPVAQWFKKWV